MEKANVLVRFVNSIKQPSVPNVDYNIPLIYAIIFANMQKFPIF